MSKSSSTAARAKLEDKVVKAKTPQKKKQRAASPSQSDDEMSESSAEVYVKRGTSTRGLPRLSNDQAGAKDIEMKPSSSAKRTNAATPNKEGSSEDEEEEVVVPRKRARPAIIDDSDDDEMPEEIKESERKKPKLDSDS